MAEDGNNAGQSIDKAIEALDLAPLARAAAYELKQLHPTLVFTSGRRDKVAQARAMASNIVKNRKWVMETYAANEASAACQKWVDDHPEVTTQDEVQNGLESVFNSLPDKLLGNLSKHLSGEAFDIQPVVTNAEEIKFSIGGLKGLGKFLDKEGGLVRWHVEF